MLFRYRLGLGRKFSLCFLFKKVFVKFTFRFIAKVFAKFPFCFREIFLTTIRNFRESFTRKRRFKKPQLNNNQLKYFIFQNLQPQICKIKYFYVKTTVVKLVFVELGLFVSKFSRQVLRNVSRNVRESFFL
jgi:hypothetical protein